MTQPAIRLSFDVAAEQVLVEALQGLDRDAGAADRDFACPFRLHASNLVFLLVFLLVFIALPEVM